MYRIFISLFLVVVFLSPIPNPGEYGTYNTVSGLAYCSRYSTCLHEIGHALDYNNDRVSQSPAFFDAVRLYILTNDNEYAILLTTYILAFENKPTKQELYAYIFQLSEGNKENMPEVFRQFYDWNEAKRYMDRLSENRIYLFRS